MTMNLTKNRLFTGTEAEIGLASELFESVSKLPIISPHGHVDPRLLAENKPFSNPAELFIYFDHYVTRLLHAEGYSLSELGKGELSDLVARKAWRIFCENWNLFAGTNSGYWLAATFEQLFGISESPSAENADLLYDKIASFLLEPDFLPRALFEKFNIEFLATTDDPTDSLEFHQQLKSDVTFSGKVVPTFRPDIYLDPRTKNWSANVAKLISSAGLSGTTYDNFIAALKNRREYFKANGAVSADHGVYEPYTTQLSISAATEIFDAALAGNATKDDMREFAGFMLTEMARMSCEDGLVMTLHAGVFRNHSVETLDEFGADTGHDVPVATEFTNNLHALLNAYGNHKNLTLILFCLDENVWNREIAPLAGFYPAVRVGAPWWFFDAPDSALRFREKTTEISGFYRGSGFIDDTRAFLSIPVRHEMARRVDSMYLARLVSAGRITEAQAKQIAVDLVDAVPRKAFKL
ncbi:MAG: glucuronate isomerase [Micrococcales bacterium]